MAGYYDNFRDYLAQLDTGAYDAFNAASGKLSSEGASEWSYLNLRWNGSYIVRKSDGSDVLSLTSKERLELYPYLDEFFSRVLKHHFYGITY